MRIGCSLARLFTPNQVLPLGSVSKNSVRVCSIANGLGVGNPPIRVYTKSSSQSVLTFVLTLEPTIPKRSNFICNSASLCSRVSEIIDEDPDAVSVIWPQPASPPLGLCLSVH